MCVCVLGLCLQNPLSIFARSLLLAPVLSSHIDQVPSLRAFISILHRWILLLLCNSPLSSAIRLYPTFWSSTPGYAGQISPTMTSQPIGQQVLWNATIFLTLASGGFPGVSSPLWASDLVVSNLALKFEFFFLTFW